MSKESKRLYRKTKMGKAVGLYDNQVGNSKKRGMPPPTYTKDELIEWLYSQELFHTLYDNWKRLDYQTRYAPSVDRKDDLIGYTMSNIQLMTFTENQFKSTRGGRPKRGIIQYSLDGELLNTYTTVAEAACYSQVNRPNIIAVCKGLRNKAGGYRWAYTN